MARYYDYLLNENGQLTYHGLDPSDYSTTVLTRIATSFVDETTSPFFLYFAPIAPHEPATAPPGAPVVEPSSTPSEPPSFDEADVSDKPYRSTSEPLSQGQLAHDRELQQAMPQSLSPVDDSIRQLIAAVSARAGLQDTVIAFTSDNGFLWGEHRIKGKIWPYEESIRVPLVVRLPDMIDGRTDTHLVLNIDLASTICELAGVTPGLPQDGTSLVPLLRGADPPDWRTSFVEEYLGHERYPGTPPDFEAIRTERYIFVRYTNGWRELYDLKTDPYELANLAGDPRVARLQASLGTKLDNLLAA
jgi:arylsulfatase A-like enzyme